MKFTQLLPSAIAVASVSAVYVYFALSQIIQAIWLPYISWSTYFLVGGKSLLLPKLIFAFTMGIIIGYLTVFLGGFLSGMISPALAISIIVFFMTFFILLTELIKSINPVSVYFLGYSSYFAYYYGKFGGMNATPIEIIPAMWCLIMLGLILGFLTSELRKKTMKLQGKKKS